MSQTLLGRLRTSLGWLSGTHSERPAPAPPPRVETARADSAKRHALCETMLRIRKADAAELEALFRHCLFKGLPERENRKEDLTGLLGTSVSEAMYVVSALHAALRVEGDVCEFGVAQGATSRLLAGEILSSQRRLWLFDSFEGLPAPSEKDRLIDDVFGLGSIEAYTGTMRCDEREVRSKLQEIGFPEERVVIKKGWVEKTLREGERPERVAFAYLDMDYYDPIRVTLDYVDTHMNVGGRMVVDDYGFFSEGAKIAVDEFVASRRGRYELELPLSFAGHFAMLTKTR